MTILLSLFSAIFIPQIPAAVKIRFFTVSLPVSYRVTVHGGSEKYALEKGLPGLRVSDAETLSLQKSAKSSVKNTELASLRQLYF